MKPQSISPSLLLSPKKQLGFHKRSKVDFLHMVSQLKLTGKVNIPIEVYPLSDGRYYIADGVHRAKAAQLANLNVIDAIVYTDSKPIGVMVPLKDVIVP